MPNYVTVTSGPSQGSLQYNGTDQIIFDSGNVTVTGNLNVSGTLTSNLFANVYDVTVSRAQSISGNHIYTNITGKPMLVSVTAHWTTNVSVYSMGLKVAGNVVSKVSPGITTGGDATFAVSSIVPSGATYEYLNLVNPATAVTGLDYWVEIY